MLKKYRAFISYRHHPLDSAIACEVQKRLERFHIPKSLQRQTGIRRLEPIFRDKTELPITSDLNDDILKALRESDHLIVICSTHTRESVWVEREIREFLKTHPLENVLTVLADGEPENVIPEVLRCKKETVPDENGVLREVMIPVEPLSCDMRACAKSLRARWIARREDIPRLASKIMNCSYDTLIQRQRRYRMQRLTAVFAAAFTLMTALAGYFLWSSTQIQKNYDNALKNQSMYLANEALKLLDEGETQTAALLALSALPGEDRDRPLVTQAEYVLSRAVGAYQTPDRENVKGEFIFEHADNVCDYKISEDGKYLYALCDFDTLVAWDLGEQRIIYSLEVDYTEKLVVSYDRGVLFLTSGKYIQGYDCITGSLLWKWNRENAYLANYQMFTGDDDGKLYAMYQMPDSASVWVSRLNALTGEEETRYEIRAEDDQGTQSFFQPHVLGNDDYIVFMHGFLSKENAGEYEKTVYGAVIYDVKADSVTVLPSGSGELYSMMAESSDYVLTNDKKLIAFMIDNAAEGGRMRLLAWDTAEKREVWAYSIAYDSLARYELKTVFHTEGEATAEAVLCTIGNEWAVINAADGKIISEVWYSEYIVETKVKDNSISGVLKNGNLAFLEIDTKRQWEREAFDQGVLCAGHTETKDGKYIYAVQYIERTKILLYRTAETDDTWRPITDFDKNVKEWTVTPYGVLQVDLNGNYSMLDSETFEPIWQYPPEEGIGDEIWVMADGTILEEAKKQWLNTKHTVLSLEKTGFSQDKSEVIFRLKDEDPNCEFNTANNVLVCLDLATGKTSSVRLPEKIYGSGICAVDGLFVFVQVEAVKNENAVVNERWMYITDRGGNVVKRIKLHLPESWFVFQMSASPDGRHVLIQDGMGSDIYLVDTDKGTSTNIITTNQMWTMVEWKHNGQFALLAGTDVYVVNASGKKEMHVSTPTHRPIAVMFEKENILVASNDGDLYRYRVSDGQVIAKCRLNNGYGSAGFTKTGRGQLVFLCGSSASIVDMDSFTMCAHIELCIGYVPERDVFIAHNYRTIGEFKRHELQDLIGMAQTQLKGRSLTSEQRQEYGLIWDIAG